MKRLIVSLSSMAMLLTLVLGSFQAGHDGFLEKEKEFSGNVNSSENYILLSAPVLDAQEIAAQVQPVTFEPEELSASEEDVMLLALLTMAEAEGEPEEGKRLVIDSVLNRMDSPWFPDTIYEVVWQPYQYSGMKSPRIDQCWVKEELVREELKHRTNYDVIFFRTKRYSSYGVPMFQVGAHYFSSYD